MALKKDGDRTKMLLSVKKTTKKKLEEIAKKQYRPVGRTLDIIIDNYDESGITKTVKAETQSKLNEVFKENNNE